MAETGEPGIYRNSDVLNTIVLEYRLCWFASMIDVSVIVLAFNRLWSLPTTIDSRDAFCDTDERSWQPLTSPAGWLLVSHGR
jgi:hypothetical protein